MKHREEKTVLLTESEFTRECSTVISKFVNECKIDNFGLVLAFAALAADLAVAFFGDEEDQGE